MPKEGLAAFSRNSKPPGKLALRVLLKTVFRGGCLGAQSNKHREQKAV